MMSGQTVVMRRSKWTPARGMRLVDLCISCYHLIAPQMLQHPLHTSENQYLDVGMWFKTRARELYSDLQRRGVLVWLASASCVVTIQELTTRTSQNRQSS
eukprot:2256824-Amphidinium_carterae.2